MFTYTDDDDVFRYSNLGDISPNSTATSPSTPPSLPPLFDRRSSKESVLCNDLAVKPGLLTNINYNLSQNMPLKNVFSKEVKVAEQTTPELSPPSEAVKHVITEQSMDALKITESPMNVNKLEKTTPADGISLSTDTLAVIPLTITENDTVQKGTIKRQCSITDDGILDLDDILSDVSVDKDMIFPAAAESTNTSTPVVQTTEQNHRIDLPQTDHKINKDPEILSNEKIRQEPPSAVLLQQPTKFDIEIDRKNQPLGIEIQHILQCGLYVVGLEHAARLDNRLKVGDKVISINDVDLSVIPDTSVFEVFMEMTQTAVVRLSVVRSDEYFELLKNAEPVTPVQHQEKAITAKNETNPDEKNEITESSQELMEITLQKGENGLGFTIATREYKSTVGSNPIFIKTVHRYGAAGTHGIMKPNDILLKVNGVSLEGMTQSEVVGMMRQLQGNVSLTLKRPSHNSTAREKQIDVSKNSPEEKSSETSPPKQTTTHTYVKKQIKLDIPLVTPEGKGIGLGISIKGKNTGKHGDSSQAYGLFVKNILKDGAAYLDGRLKPNDQLISTGGDSLLGRLNKDAMLVFKNSLERSTYLNSVSLLIIRKEVISSQSRVPKASLEDGSLSSDPSRYRNLSVSSPNLGSKRKDEKEADGGGRCVVFDEKIESIPSTEEVLESDEDVVFVGDLVDDGTDPFIRESIFRKSMKKTCHTPFDPQRLNIKRASSHDSLAQHSDNTPTMPLLKRGLSSESIFSGKSGEPIYSTIKPATLSKDPEKGDNSKTKQKGLLNFFSKKPNKKKGLEVSEPNKATDPEENSCAGRSDGSSESRNTNSNTNTHHEFSDCSQSSRSRSQDRSQNKPKHIFYTGDFHERKRSRSHEKPSGKLYEGQIDKSQDRQRRKSYDRYMNTNYERKRDKSHERRKNKAEEKSKNESYDIKKGKVFSENRQQHEQYHHSSYKLSYMDSKWDKASDFYQEWESGLAESSGLGYIEHGPISNDYEYEYDRHSNHSSHSSRSRTDTNRCTANHRGYPNSHLRNERCVDSIATNTHNKFRYGRSSPTSLRDLDRVVHTPSAPLGSGYHNNSNIRNDTLRGHTFNSNNLDLRGETFYPVNMSFHEDTSNGEPLSDV